MVKSLKLSQTTSNQVGGSITFGNTGTGEISYSIVKGLGRNYASPNAAINLHNSNVFIDHCDINGGDDLGILVDNHSSPTIENCSIRNFPNSGIRVRSGEPLIKNNHIFSNTGGVAAIWTDSKPFLENNTKLKTQYFF